jgi:hypothetical protein
VLGSVEEKKELHPLEIPDDVNQNKTKVDGK